MIHSELVNLIKEKVNYTRMSIFLFIIGLIGIGLQFVEPYAMFWIMFPVLLIMLSSVILILQFCLKELDKFQENCSEKDIEKHCIELFPEKGNFLLFGAYFLMVIVYFICIYRLQFVEINLMGLYILVLGGGTFFLALICYEVCIRLTISLKEIEKNISKISYDKIYPQNTLWLQYFFRFHKVLKNAALVISVLFVLENSMLFFANYKKLALPVLTNVGKIPSLFNSLPFEWWVIWIYIFVTIVIAIPFMAYLRNQSLNNIVAYIQSDFQMRIMKEHKENDLYNNLQDYFSVLNIIQVVQKSLIETYLPHRFDRFVSLGASLLTCFMHLLSFCMIIIPNLLNNMILFN